MRDAIQEITSQRDDLMEVDLVRPETAVQ